jgi:hypothetical protein
MLSLPVAQKPLLGIGGGKKYFLPLANASLRLLLFDSRCSTALSTDPIKPIHFVKFSRELCSCIKRGDLVHADIKKTQA